MGSILDQISAAVRVDNAHLSGQILSIWLHGQIFMYRYYIVTLNIKSLGAALSHLLFGYYKKIMKKIQAVSTWKAGEYRIPHPLPPWI